MDEKIEVKHWNYKKTHLEYQMTEYDCGPISVLNALRYLFNREEIPPDVYKYILQNTLDKSEKHGTSCIALEKLCLYLNNNSDLNIECESLSKDHCSIYDKKLEETLKNNGVAIIRVWQTTQHYCLLTGLDEKYAYIFDPYYFDITYYDNDKCVEIIKDKPFEYNRKVLKSRLDEKNKKDFSLVQGENMQIVLMIKK